VRIFGLARRFGIGVEPFYPRSGTVVAYLGGKRIEGYEPSQEEFWGYTSLRNAYPGLLERSAVRVALRLRAWLRQARGKVPWATYRIQGGTQRLAEALAEACGADIRLGASVESITQGDDRVVVGYRRDGSAESLEADYAVCAVPLSMVNTLRFSPVLAEAKRRLADDVPFNSAVRIYLQMRRPYWRDHGYNGFGVTDTVGEIWDPHFDEEREPALLVCYAKYGLARKIGALDDDQRLRYAVAELEKVFPGSAENFEAGTSHYWDHVPWIRGGWPEIRKFKSRAPIFREPEGRVYFAGDYAGDAEWLNTAEGAVESGQHTARSICRRIAEPAD
jgi:monoamine oxidase